MTNGKRVLLLYITERSGHHSAALAIRKGMELRDPSVVISCVNAFSYAFPFTERVIHYIYLTVIQRFPKIWENMYDNPNLVARSQRIKHWIHRIAIRRLKKLVDSFKPDIIVCTQAFPCGIVADYKRFYRSKIPLIGVLTDFAPHSFWVYDNVDYYIAPSDQSREMLVHKGVAREKIMTLGIPIDPKFIKRFDHRELLANYGLAPEIPVLMIMGGGHGLGPIKESLRLLDSSSLDVQFIVICGLNIRLYHWINQARFRNRVLNFKFTDQVERLMTISNLIITKPGGITTAEALSKKLPMIILNPIPGQEARNTEVLVKSGAAVKVDSTQDLLPAVEKTLKSFRTQPGISLSKPESSLDIAKFILELVGPPASS